MREPPSASSTPAAADPVLDRSLEHRKRHRALVEDEVRTWLQEACAPL